MARADGLNATNGQRASRPRSDDATVTPSTAANDQHAEVEPQVAGQSQQQPPQRVHLVAERVDRATARTHGGMSATGYSAFDAKNSGIVIAWPMPISRSRVSTSPAIVTESVAKNADPSTTASDRAPAMCSGFQSNVHAEDRAEHEDDDDLADRADARRERLAGDQRRARRRRRHELGQDRRRRGPR